MKLKLLLPFLGLGLVFLPARSDAFPATTLDTSSVASPIPDSTSGLGLQPSPPDPEPLYFYRGLRFGSESLIHPLAMMVNGGYGILQLDNRDNRPGDIDYANGVRNVWKNLRDPLGSIRAEGFGSFLTREIIPISTDTKSARYWPNYTQHLIGGGMSYRLMAEWYRLHGFTHPRRWSIGTMVVYHFLNEVVENDGFVGYTTDPVADLYIFDPLSILLFESDRVSEFFSRTLHMADWSYQPAYDPKRGTLENNGQNFALKYKLPWSKRWSVFHYFGTHGELGMSFTRPNGSSFSVAGGLKAGDLVDLGRGTRTVDLVPTAGFFYDRDNSLLFSLLYARTKDYTVRLNVYPGMIRLGAVSPGIFLAVNRDNLVLMGLTFGNAPYLPAGLATLF